MGARGEYMFMKLMKKKKGGEICNLLDFSGMLFYWFFILLISLHGKKIINGPLSITRIQEKQIKRMLSLYLSLSTREAKRGRDVMSKSCKTSEG